MDDKNRSEMYKQMMKAIQEGKLKFNDYDSYLYVMNKQDRDTLYRNNWTPPPSAEIYGSPFVPQGKVYKVSKAFMNEPIDRYFQEQKERVLAQFAEEIRKTNDLYFSRGLSGLTSYAYGDFVQRKTKSVRLGNANWSLIWDDWRYDDYDYKQFWLYRAVMWIVRKVRR